MNGRDLPSQNSSPHASDTHAEPDDDRTGRVERLFREYHAPLVRYLTRRLGDRDWAAEVAREPFLPATRQDRLNRERCWRFGAAANLVENEERREAAPRS